MPTGSPTSETQPPLASGRRRRRTAVASRRALSPLASGADRLGCAARSAASAGVARLGCAAARAAVARRGIAAGLPAPCGACSTAVPEPETDGRGAGDLHPTRARPAVPRRTWRTARGRRRRGPGSRSARVSSAAELGRRRRQARRSSLWRPADWAGSGRSRGGDGLGLRRARREQAQRIEVAVRFGSRRGCRGGRTARRARRLRSGRSCRRPRPPRPRCRPGRRSSRGGSSVTE